MKRIVLAYVALAATAAAAQHPPLDRHLPARLEPVYRTIDGLFDGERAMRTVTFMSPFWRLAGNPGFNASLDYLHQQLREAAVPVRIGEYQNAGHGWEVRRARYAVRRGGTEAAVPQVPRQELTVAINSFPTRRRARLVDVGRGPASASEVRGAIVMGDGPLSALWKDAVVAGGAIGVISTAVPAYNRPDDTPDVVAWGSIPYDAERRAFGVKAAPVMTAMLRDELARGPVELVVEIDTVFHDGPNRTLVAEIPGRSRPDERIVLVAHVQEPGANDDASGCATLLELVQALQAGIDSGRIPPPQRTLTFLWVDEIRGSEQWLHEDPERARQVQYMFSLDMTGEDTAKTGGTFLIEKQADPSAVWTRPSDPHSEWGASEVAADSLKGSLLNDVHLAVCLRRARDTGWVVRTNPYEGGSDHTVFARAGVPSLLDWHFTDRYYHTNLDTPDKTSALEMTHVGVAVATTAWLLATAHADDARALAALIGAAAEARFALEARNRSELMAVRATDDETERRVLAAWRQWYTEALDSVQRLPVEGADAALRAAVDEQKARLARLGR